MKQAADVIFLAPSHWMVNQAMKYAAFGGETYSHREILILYLNSAKKLKQKESSRLYNLTWLDSIDLTS